MIMPSQAQKHVTHNEALTLLDGLLSPVVKSAAETQPPAGAQTDDAFLVAGPATGVWFGQEGKLAFNTDAGWRFAAPVRGMTAFFAADSSLRVFEQGVWQSLGNFVGALSFAMLGINTAADALNKLALRSNAALFTALEAAGGGNGDFQLKLNKEAPADVASLLFQTGFSGRAEMGISGGNDFSVKVSADGVSWQSAVSVDAASGLVTLTDNSISNAALADMPQGRLKGRSSAGAGDPQDLTGAQATALLDTFSAALKGLVPASGGGSSAFLRADGSWAAPVGGGSANLTQVTLDFGAQPVFSKTFSFTHPGAAPGQKAVMTASAVMQGSLSADELEMDGFSAAAAVSAADTVLAVVTVNPGPVSGLRNFNFSLA